MATVVVDTLVSASVDMLLEKLKDLTTKLDDPLYERLISRLESLQGLVNNAEEKQFNNSDVNVKGWLVRLQGAAFEAEDLFDQINTDSLRRRVEAEYSKLPNFLSSCFNFLSSCFSLSNKTINVEMQTLLERLESFAKEGHDLGLIIGASSSVLHETPTSSVAVDESDIYGRDNDTKKLKAFLLSDDARDGGGKIGVVSVVGMGGLGKTTLAKLLYNDSKVDKKFTLKGWAHISKDFDVLKVTKALLESITKNPVGANNPDTLQVQLQKILNGQITTTF